MITVDEALNRIAQHSAKSLDQQEVKVENALGRALATEIVAPISLPSFRQSAMDGYALCIHNSLVYKVIGEVKAGDALTFELHPGEAVRIFTGGSVPASADTVIMQEKTSEKNKQLLLEEMPSMGANIREIGTQIKKGSIPLPKGHWITPATLGLLKSLGIEKVWVHQNPKVSIVVTGNELLPAGAELSEGKIYESNGSVLQAVLKQKGIETTSIASAEDTLEATENALSKAMEHSDLVLISGGISVGDYDFVGTALNNLGVQQIFYKVLQKPGKPFFFGIKNNTYVFALPGNPGSTLSCYYVYVNTLIDRISGRSQPGLLRIFLPLTETLENKGNRALFLKANVTQREVEILDYQNSSMMISFATANALVYVPSEKNMVEKGELVETLILPHGRSN